MQKSVFKRRAHFARPFKVLFTQQRVKQPNKWVQKHLTRGFVWSTIVGFETFCFSLHFFFLGNDSLKKTSMDSKESFAVISKDG